MRADRKAERKARMEQARSALRDEAAGIVEDFVADGRASALEDCLDDIEDLKVIESLQRPAERCASAIRSLLRELKSVPDERAETWAARNLPPED